MPVNITWLQLANTPLKHLMRLFAPDEPLQIRALGDTWHSSAGYVDETLVSGMTQVGDLLTFPYDFGGLVAFEAIIAGVAITYHGDYYQLAGPPKTMHQLRTRIQELTAQPTALQLVPLPTLPFF